MSLSGAEWLEPDPDTDVCRGVGESPGRAPGLGILQVPDRWHSCRLPDRFPVWRGYMQRCHVQPTLRHYACYVCAFWTVPVDRWLLGMKWESQGPPKLYNAVVDALLWILVQLDRVHGLQYLDNFLLFCGPDSSNCETSLRRC